MVDDPPSASVGADACRELHGPVEPPQTQRDVERAPAHMLDGFGTAAVDDVDEASPTTSAWPFIPALPEVPSGWRGRRRCAGR